jgi:hypothetical protein
MEWDAVALFFVFAFPGITIAGIASYWTKNIHSPWTRVLARSALVSIAIAPMLAGHGGIYPAVSVFIFASPRYWWWGLLPMLFVWALATPIIYAITRRSGVEPPAQEVP